jgi:competence protein ComEC
MKVGESYHRPIIPLTVALAAGIALGSAAPGFDVWALALAGLCGVAVVRSLLKRAPAAFSPLLLFAALGYASLQPWAHPRFSEDHVIRFLETGPWEITGVVDARPLEFEDRARFILQVERLQNGGESHSVAGRLRATVVGHLPDIEQGDRVLLRGRIRPIRNFNNPGGFDYRRHMSHRGVWGGVFAEGLGLRVLEKEARRGFLQAVDAARGAIGRHIDLAVTGPEASVLKALVTGDGSQIPPDVREAFAQTGTGHILAISGLHISLVASTAFAAIRWLLSWVPLVLQRAWLRKGAAVLTLVPVLGYALVAGFSPSTQRAFLMVAVFLAALLAERETELMNTLAAAALVILVVQPASLFSISFQLSFAAVCAIVYGIGRLSQAHPPAAAREEAGNAKRLRRWAFVFFGVSLLATWGTLPLGMYYFNRVSFIGLLSNCVAIPIVGYLGVTLGLAGAALMPLSLQAAAMCFEVAGQVLAFSVSLMRALAELPFAAARTVTPSVLEVVLFYLFSWAAFYLLTERGPAATGAATSSAADYDERPPAVRKRRLRALALHPISGRGAAAALLAFSLLAGSADAGYWLYQRFGRRDLRMTLLDVGQGSAALLEMPGGTTVLVDGGGFSDRAAFDVGARVVAPYLWHKKIASVDTLILSHPNSDHMNGLIFIADNFNVRTLWTNGESRPMPGYEDLMRTALARGIEVPAYADIPRYTTIGTAVLEVLYPPVDFLARVDDRWRRDENNNSLVIRASCGHTSVLLPGDIMQPAERELVAIAAEKLKSTVLVAPHHGSRTSSTVEFLAEVDPQAVLISSAGRPGSGLPHAQTLGRYASRGVRVYRTDRHGAIRVSIGGEQALVETYLAPVFSGETPE